MKRLFVLLILLLSLCACAKSTLDGSSTSIPGSISQEIEIEETDSFEMEEKTFYRDDNKKICGELYIPNNSYDEFPLVILSHGFGANMSSTRELGKSLCKIGFASFVYDFIGGGYSIKSDGQMTEMSVLTEANDLNTVLDELKEDERINNDNIFLLGQSQGGFVSTYVAGTRDDIKGLIDYYPAFCIRDDAEEVYKSADEVPEIYQLAKMGGVSLGKIYYVDCTSFDIYEVMEDVECNTLLMHGTSDNVVPISYSQRASETIPNCEYVVYQGQGHGFSGDADKDSAERTIKFLKENLN